MATEPGSPAAAISPDPRSAGENPPGGSGPSSVTGR